jgi:hypothetical protein
MKKALFLFAAGLCLFLFNASQTNSQALGFYIVNNTGVTLNNIYVSPAESNNWGNDILPNDMFENQSTVMVTIPADYGATCKFDIKITDIPGNAVIFTNVDACKLHTLTIHWDGTYEVQNVNE